MGAELAGKGAGVVGVTEDGAVQVKRDTKAEVGAILDGTEIGTILIVGPALLTTIKEDDTDAAIDPS